MELANPRERDLDDDGSDSDLSSHDGGLRLDMGPDLGRTPADLRRTFVQELPARVRLERWNRLMETLSQPETTSLVLEKEDLMILATVSPRRKQRFRRALRGHAALRVVHLHPIIHVFSYSLFGLYAMLGATFSKMPSLQTIHITIRHHGAVAAIAFLLSRFKPTRRLTFEFEFLGEASCDAFIAPTPLFWLTVPSIDKAVRVHFEYDNNRPNAFYDSLANVPCFRYMVCTWWTDVAVRAEDVEILVVLLSLPCFQQFKFNFTAFTSAELASQLSRAIALSGVVRLEFHIDAQQPTSLLDWTTAISAGSLRELELVRPRFASEREYENFAGALSMMRNLEVFKLADGIPDNVAPALACAICRPTLKHLVVHTISNRFLQALGRSLRNCILLQECTLCEDSRHFFGSVVDTEAVLSILEGCCHCPELLTLVLPATTAWSLDCAVANCVVRCRKMVRLGINLEFPAHNCSSPELLLACKKHGVIELVELQVHPQDPLGPFRLGTLWDPQFLRDMERATKRNKENRIFKPRFEALPRGETPKERALFASALSKVVAVGSDNNFRPHLVYLALRSNTSFLLDARNGT